MKYNFKDLLSNNRELKVVVKHSEARLFGCDVSDDAIGTFSIRFGIDFYIEATSCQNVTRCEHEI